METPLLTESQVAERLRLSRRTLQGFRGRGEGPPYVKLGSGRCAPVRYPEDLLNEYLRAQVHRPPSEVPETK